MIMSALEWHLVCLVTTHVTLASALIRAIACPVIKVMLMEIFTYMMGLAQLLAPRTTTTQIVTMNVNLVSHNASPVPMVQPVIPAPQQDPTQFSMAMTASVLVPVALTYPVPPA
jgi:hypothetical protein